jgi:hypothetical protein
MQRAVRDELLVSRGGTFGTCPNLSLAQQPRAFNRINVPNLITASIKFHAADTEFDRQKSRSTFPTNRGADALTAKFVSEKF